MAQEKFLTILQCPCCGGSLDLEWREPASGLDVEFGVLRCQCYRYGVALGVPIIRQLSPPHNSIDPIVAHLDNREYGKAIHRLLARELPSSVAAYRASLVQIAAKLLRWMPTSGKSELLSQVIQPSETLRAALARLRPTYFGEYLYYRHANPSLLASLPVLAAIARGVEGAANASPLQANKAAEEVWSIDLGCGIGHTAYTLKALSPRTEVVAADLDFLNLMFTKCFFMPDAHYICFDAEAGLPFRDGVFRAAFSLDCVHYIRGKLGLGRELRRVGQRDAIYAITHLHNAQRSNPNPGIPLTADGYLKVFEPLNGDIYSEASLLERFCRTGRLSLDEAGKDTEMYAFDAFSYLSRGMQADDLSSQQLDRYMAQRTDRLALNPVYSATTVGDSVRLQLQWPSQTLRDECSAEFQPLPEKVEIAPALVDAVFAHRFGDLPMEMLQTLVRSFVIVPLPSGRYLSGKGAI